MQSEAEAYNAQGTRHLNAKSLKNALDCFDKALSLDPELAAAHCNRGITLQILGRKEEAASAFQRAIDLAHDAAETGLKLGRLYLDAGKRNEAIDAFRKATVADTTNVTAHMMLAWALPKQGDNMAEAEQHLRQVVQLEPENAVAHCMLGFRLQERGVFEEAMQEFEHSLALNPGQAGAYFGITQSKRIGESDRPMVAQMEAVLERGGLNPPDTVNLHFALGKSFDELKEYEKAIQHFDEANRILAANPGPGVRPLDQKRYAFFIDQNISTFTKAFFTKHEKLRTDSEKPVFIVGMPRSGTTLVEQIISAHPEVTAGGEITYWRDQAGPLRVQMAGGKVDPVATSQAGSRYLELLDSLGPGKKRVTDKMPVNFLSLGPIHLLFPNAHIIHCQRNPVDTCLSMYMTKYAAPPEFGGSRDNLVFGYQQYQKLMTHWRRTLPEDRFMEVEYEQLVANREPLTRQMVEFCGLDWNEDSLYPEANKRTVMTPSLWQARQPVYTTSVERWRNYEPWLGPFKKLMG